MIHNEPISTIMTEHVITLNRTDSIEKAEHLFKQHHIRHIPVVDENLIVGMLSYTDLKRLSFADITSESEGDVDAMVYNMLTINQIMKKKVVSVAPDASIKDVVEIFANREFHALPVVKSGHLVGIVTTTDLMKYFLDQFE